MEDAKPELSPLEQRETQVLFRDFRFGNGTKEKFWKPIPIKKYDMPNSLSTATDRLPASKFNHLRKLSYSKIARSTSNSDSNRKRVYAVTRPLLQTQEFQSLTKVQDNTFSALGIGFESSQQSSPIHSYRNSLHRRKVASMNSSDLFKDSTNGPSIVPCSSKRAQGKVNQIDMQLDVPDSPNKVSSDRLKNAAQDLFKRINSFKNTHKQEKGQLCDIGVNTDELTIDDPDALSKLDTFNSQISQTFNSSELLDVPEPKEASLELKAYPVEKPEVHITYSSQIRSPRRNRTIMRNSCSNIPSRAISKASERRSVFLKHKDHVILDETESNSELKIRGKSAEKDKKKDSREFMSIISVRYVSKISNGEIESNSHTERRLRPKEVTLMDSQPYRYSVEYNQSNQLNKGGRKKLPIRRLLP
jgi:hypothetical protein